jgi:small conductance mechanosensitive channel
MGGKMDEVNVYANQAWKLIEKYGPSVLLALITLFVGLWIIRILVKSFSKAMVKAKVDESLYKFLASLISILLKILLVISVASMLGIEATSFIAVLGAAGLAVGLALQGSLSNFAGGVLILLFKPFRVGDAIDAQGYVGKVHAIHVLNTILKTFDNKTIIIPNGSLANGNIVNFSTEETRRVDMTFGIGYGDDIKKAKAVLQRLVDSDERILKEPESMIAVSELGDSSVNFVVRVWCNSADYWGIYFDMQEKVKYEFDKEGISIPFPQRDVHLFQKN